MMAEFYYQGRNSSGQLIKGKRSATSSDELASLLIQEGIIPIHIKAARASFSLKNLANLQITEQRVKLEEMLVFCQQMRTLFKAGIPILSAIQRLADESRNPTMKKTLLGLAEHLGAGQILSSAMQRYPKVFPPIAVKLVQLGEESGRLDESFVQIADYLTLQDSTRKKVKSTLRYPMTVFSAILIAIILTSLFVIPNFAKLFASFKTALPLPTRIIIGSSNFMRGYWFYLLIASIAGFWLWRRWVKTPKGRVTWDRWQLKLPIIGTILAQIVYARFARTFAIVLRAGIPLAQGMALVADAVDNYYARQCIQDVVFQIEQGATLTRAATQSKLFSSILLQMLSVGEESGAIEQMMDEAGDYYERETHFNLERLAAKIEPILLLFVAGMVLILALGIFLPMWDMMSLMEQH